MNNLDIETQTIFDTENGNAPSLTTHIVDDRGSTDEPCSVWVGDTITLDIRKLS